MASTHEHPPWEEVWGTRFIVFSMIAAGLTSATVASLLPAANRQQVNGPILWALLPVCPIAAAGILLTLVAWIRFPYRHTELNLGLSFRPDGKHFGILVRHMACFTLSSWWMLSFGVFFAPQAELSIPMKCLIFYCSTTWCWFLVYLATIFKSSHHRATTTYLNIFPLVWIAILFIPLTWVLLVALNLRHDKKSVSPPEIELDR